mmetsp:Transcript_47774/g.108410  ORF Transcript_47774/g.108410 Transcript_47774/m.108410 type:complete len:386 (-) Transcript_47774:307-1464(-)
MITENMDNHPGVAYSKLSTSEAPNAPAPGQPPDVAGTMGQAQDALEVAHQAQDMQGQAEDAIKTAQQAQDMQKSIGKAGPIIKLFKILSNPSQIVSILKSETSKEGLEDRYGTDDPKVISEKIFNDLKEGITKGTWSIGKLAFCGGAYATVIGALELMPPAVIFKIASPLHGVCMMFLFLFGIVILTLESEGDTIHAGLKGTLTHYCKALETIWGRGYFYIYVGVSTKLAPGHDLYGYYMIVVGIIMLVLYRMSSEHMKKMKQIFRDNGKLKKYFAKHAGVDETLSREELVLLFNDIGIQLNHSELEMLLERMDPDHSGSITLKEIEKALDYHEDKKKTSVTIKNVPKMDTSKYDVKMVAVRKRADGTQEEQYIDIAATDIAKKV